MCLCVCPVGRRQNATAVPRTAAAFLAAVNTRRWRALDASQPPQLRTKTGRRQTCSMISLWVRCSTPVWCLTLWRPLLPYRYSYEASCTRPGWAVICNFWHLGTLTLSPERQSARMSKITIDSLLSQDALGYSCTHVAKLGVKGLWRYFMAIMYWAA